MQPEFVSLGVADLLVSRIGFGTSKLFRLHSSRERQHVLESAFDAGIRHFDTARMYGLGLAERELGRFLSRHRGDVTVATKFGIPVSKTGSFLRPIQGLVRKFVSAVPGLQRRLRGRPSPLMAERCFDLPTARLSLETSLRSLNIEAIDIYFLHEPTPNSSIPDEMEDFLAAARKRGDIRAWGVSGRLSEVLPVYRARPELVPILQYASDAVNRISEPAPPAVPRITYGPFAGAIEKIVAVLDASDEASRAWETQIGEPRDRDSIAAVLLAEILMGNDPPPVVFSTTRGARITPLLDKARRRASSPAGQAFSPWLAAHCGR